MNRLKIALASAGFALIALIGLGNAQAAGLTYDIQTTFELNDKEPARVEYVIAAQNENGETPPDSLTLPVVGTDINDTSVKLNGNELEGSVDEDSKSLTFGLPEAASQNKWSLKVSYRSELAATFGASRIFQIPKLDFGDMPVAKQELSISSDLAMGVATMRGPAANNTKLTIGHQIQTWVNEEGTINHAVGLVFGDQSVAEVTLKTTLKNDGWWWKTLTATLPPDTNQQQVFLESIEPRPTRVRLDIDGNILAEYRLRPKQSIDIEAKGLLVVKNLSYTLNSKQQVGDIPQELVDRYTATTDLWKGGTVSVDLSGKNAVESISAIFDAVVANADSGQSLDYEQSKRLADTLVGELRVNKIPARTVLGKVYGDGNQLFNEAKSHAWIETYVPGTGWITLDPTFAANGEVLGSTDVQHVGLVLRGVEDDYPPEQLDGVSVSYIERDAPEVDFPTPDLEATKYVLLPGIALEVVNVHMPAGIIVDNTGVVIGDNRTVVTGSLAPLQTAVARSFAFLGDAFSSQSVNFGVLTGEAIEDAAAKTTINVNYIPMAIILIVITVVIVVIIVRKRRGPSERKLKKSKENVILATENEGGDIEEENLIEANQLPPKPDTSARNDTQSVDDIRENIRGRVDDQYNRERSQRRRNGRKPPLIQ